MLTITAYTARLDGRLLNISQTERRRSDTAANMIAAVELAQRALRAPYGRRGGGDPWRRPGVHPVTAFSFDSVSRRLTVTYGPEKGSQWWTWGESFCPAGAYRVSVPFAQHDPAPGYEVVVDIPGDFPVEFAT